MLRTEVISVGLTSLLLVSICMIPQIVAADDGSVPAVEMNVGAVADEYADSMYPDSAYGSRPVLYVGNSYDRAQNVSGPARIYILFDLSSIPRHAYVVSAEMMLYQMYAPTSSQTYEVRLVQTGWNETTANWKTKPVNDTGVLSTARAPTDKDVWMSWNVTSPVQSWVNGDVTNYGFVISIQNERTGVANEASGFYSREYPKDELKPKLRVLCKNHPPFTYFVGVHLSGLPAELSSLVVADESLRTVTRGDGVAYFLFESGTTHLIRAEEYVSAGGSVRYHAEANSIEAAQEGEFTVTYEPQFLVEVKSEPGGLFEREWSEWYELGAQIETPSAREIAEESTDMILVLDGWYVNNERQRGNPIDFVVNGPAVLTARYTTMYKVTVNSPLGKTSGSGWYAAGSSVEISVTPTYVSAEGVLGYLGLGMTFDHWSGSLETTSPTTTITVNRPIQAEAVWREDRSRLILGIASLIGLVLVVLVALGRRTRSLSS